MIVGVGIDMVNVDRFARSVEVTPGLAPRVLTPAECALPVESQAARFAVKEALIKALGGPVGSWHDVETSHGGAPVLHVSGEMQAEFERRSIDAAHVSMSHDGGFAIATVILESR